MVIATSHSAKQTVNWRNIAITLKIPLQNRGGGEQTAQACANACLRQLPGRGFRLARSQVTGYGVETDSGGFSHLYRWMVLGSRMAGRRAPASHSNSCAPPLYGASFLPAGGWYPLRLHPCTGGRDCIPRLHYRSRRLLSPIWPPWCSFAGSRAPIHRAYPTATPPDHHRNLRLDAGFALRTCSAPRSLPLFGGR